MDLRNKKALTPVESGFPISSITIDLTTGCNLGCDYCFSGGCKEYQVSNLTFEQGKKTIDWLFLESTRGDEKMVDISFWGGEPLIRWDLLKELVLYAEEKAKEFGIRVIFGGTTNVTLLTPDKFDFMDDHGICFLLSIDGIKEHHDKHRKYKDGRSSWDIIDKNATEILKRWPDQQVRMSYSVENLDGIIDDLNYLYDKGFYDIVYSPVSEGDWTDERLEVLKEKWVEIGDWYVDKKKNGSKIRLKFLEDACRCINGVSREGQSPCGAGRGYVGIDTEGAIRACHRFHKFEDTRPWYEQETIVGHIDYGILNQEWRDNFIKWDAKKDMPESCHDCEAYLSSCVGGCWATNWDLTGDLRKVPKMNCVAELTTRAQAAQVQAELGQGYVNSLIGRRPTGALPEVQGCQCYNVHDDLFGRQTINSSDPYQCICNMSTYGQIPSPIEKCSCYNVENMVGGQRYEYRDMSGASCKSYQYSPVDKALDYLLQVEANVDKLTDEELKKINKFIDAKDQIEEQKKRLSDLKGIRESLKE